MIIIGEKINGSIPRVAQAIAERDSEWIKHLAQIQDEARSTFIDCCASVPEEEEVEMFLEYCVKEYKQGRNFSEEEKTFLEKNGYSLT